MRHTKRGSRSPLGLMGVLALAVTGQAWASGFAIKEQGAVGQGNAGATAGGEDLSTMFFNPAGLARFSGNQAQGAMSLIVPSAKFNNRGSTDVLGAPLTGGNGGDAGVGAVVPAIYAMWDHSPDLKLGLAINAPFGLATSYATEWAGRYHGTTSKILNISTQPTAGYRINPWLSIGGGIYVDYTNAELGSAIDFGTVCLATVPAATCTALGLLPQRADGDVRLEVDDWSWGFSLGMLIEPRKDLRIGVAYRSQVSHKLHGTADFNVPAAASVLTAGGAVFRDVGANANLTLPELVSFGVAYDVTPQWTLLADAAYTRWTRLQELRVRFENPLQPDLVTPEDWNSTWFLSLGANYKYSDRWTFRAGVAYDQTPVDDQFRTPRLPDQDRLWLAFGVSYNLSDALSLDVGYTHIFASPAPIDLNDGQGHRLFGSYDVHIDILSVHARMRF